MKLYKIEASNWEAFFGIPDEPIERDVRIIAQTPSNDAFLFLSKNTFDEDELELLDSVPIGFDFTYCQEWGLTIDDDVVDRVIIDLRRKAYGTWENQMDMQYWDKVNDTSIWQDAVAKVKLDNPKS